MRTHTAIAIIFILCTLAFLHITDSINSVYYSGDKTGSVYHALELADFLHVDEPTLADVIVLNGSFQNQKLSPISWRKEPVFSSL